MLPCMITIYPRATHVLTESTYIVTRMLGLARYYTYHTMYNVFSKRLELSIWECAGLVCITKCNTHVRYKLCN